MEKHKHELEHLIRSFEILDSKWARLNEEVNSFIGENSDQTIDYNDFCKFLNIAREENDVVNNCQSLAGLLTDINADNDRLVRDKSLEAEDNANVSVYCDEIYAENVEADNKETPVVISDQSSNSVEEDLHRNLIVECENSKKLIHDTISNTESVINETSPKIIVTEGSAKNDATVDPFDDDSESISSLDDTEHFFNDVLSSNDSLLSLFKENKRSKYDDNKLNYHSTESEDIDFHCSSNETIGEGIPCNELKVKETTNREQSDKSTNYLATNSARLDFKNCIVQETSFNDHNTYHGMQRNSGNERDKLVPIDLEVDVITRGRKRKNMILFKNVCYFNLINRCNRNDCTFPHVIPDVEAIKVQLQTFNDNLLIEEYDLIKDNKIKFDYGLCFLEECSNRNLSREVIRMAIDFIKIKKNNEEEAYFQTTVIKSTLHYINYANIDECEDLLTSTNFSRDRCFCDILLETISVTEDFSDYKLALIKLINIIPKAVSNKTATNILKQICDIEYEATLSRALLKVIKYTHPKIFRDQSIQRFENMIKHDTELVGEFLNLKNLLFASNTEVNNTGDKNRSTDTNQKRNLKTTCNKNHTTNGNSTLCPPADREFFLSSNSSQKERIDTRNIVKPKETLTSKPLSVTRRDSTNSERVLSTNIRSRQSGSGDTKNIVKPKEELPRKTLPAIRRHDPNYVHKDIKRRKCPVKIRQWMNLRDMSQDGTKENKED